MTDGKYWRDITKRNFANTSQESGTFAIYVISLKSISMPNGSWVSHWNIHTCNGYMHFPYKWDIFRKGLNKNNYIFDYSVNAKTILGECEQLQFLPDGIQECINMYFNMYVHSISM